MLSWQFGSRGLVLHGETGTCKTRAAFLLLKRLHFNDRKRVVAFHGNSFGHICAREFGNQTGEAWINSLQRTDVVFLDDLGKEKLTERVESELFALVETRIAKLLPLIITTNFVGDRLAAKLSPDRGAPLVRRVREFCKSVAFP